MLLHSLQQCRLRFGRCAVNLVRQHDIAEHGTGLELEAGVSVLILDDNVGTRDIGRHQVRGELNAGKRQIKYPPQTAHQSGLAHAGHALQQHVAARDHGNDGSLDDLVLPDNVPAYLRENVVAYAPELLNAFLVNHDDLPLSFYTCGKTWIQGTSGRSRRLPSCCPVAGALKSSRTTTVGRCRFKSALCMGFRSLGFG